MLSEKPFKVRSGMVYLPGGTFLMGSLKPEVDQALAELSESEKLLTEQILSEYPKHDVYISPFFIDKYEVTQAEFIRVMGYNPSLNKADLNNPVDSVVKGEALEYCKRTNKRLPTEAEWEYAARGGTNTKYFWSDEEDGADEFTWYEGNSGLRSHPVGLKKPNAFGLYDMIGNLWEWIADWYSKDYYTPDYYRKQFHIDPQGPETGERSVMRGASYMSPARGLRCSLRGRHMPDNRWELHTASFRCACSAPRF